MYCKPCPNCGANLDPGENCDCDKTPIENKKVYTKETEKKEKKKYQITEEDFNNLWLALDGRYPGR